MLSIFLIVCVCVNMCYTIVLKMCLNMYIICIYLWCVRLLCVVALMFFCYLLVNRHLVYLHVGVYC